MTTYNSYAEAKIANPSEDIYATKISMGGRVEVFGVYVIIANITSNYYICEPSKYCMTVEKFLADGHKFVEGDVIYSRPLSKVIPVLSNGEFGVSYPVDGANNPMSSDDNRFILRAAALEEKPKRVKVSYVKVEDSIFDLRPDFEDGELFQAMNNESYQVITGELKLAELLSYGLVCRKVETEIDWRDEVKRLDESAIFHDDGDLFLIIDSKSDDFISMCHDVASLTEKPTN